MSKEKHTEILRRNWVAGFYGTLPHNTRAVSIKQRSKVSIHLLYVCCFQMDVVFYFLLLFFFFRRYSILFHSLVMVRFYQIIFWIACFVLLCFCLALQCLNVVCIGVRFGYLSEVYFRVVWSRNYSSLQFDILFQ